jgi:hypothetical protein
MISQQFTSFEAAASWARTVCEPDAQQNLLLTIDLDLSDNGLGRPFHGSFDLEAQLWQSPVRPDSLYVNHGEYIHRSGDGMRYVIEELRGKPTSRRAAISLMSCADLVGSGDEPRPSFMLFQAACSDADSRRLNATAYYRSLEVCEFLPLNLAELAMMVSAIVAEMPGVQQVSIVLHAFHAYAQQGFPRLTRPELDSIPGADIEAAVSGSDFTVIEGWLAGLKASASVAVHPGLIYLVEAVKARGDLPQSEAALEALAKELAYLDRLRQISSHGTRVAQTVAKIEILLTQSRDAISKGV